MYAYVTKVTLFYRCKTWQPTIKFGITHFDVHCEVQNVLDGRKYGFIIPFLCMLLEVESKAIAQLRLPYI